MFQDYIQLLSKIGIPSWFSELIWPLFPFVGIMFTGLFFGVVFLVLMERRVLALLTVRKGPNRVGYDGVLQCFADGLKIMFKEDIISEGANKFIFTLAPCIVLASAIISFAVLPFTQILIPSNIATGLLFFIAISSVHAIVILIAGWASNNKYSLIGGIRATAQSISYEIPLVITAISIVVLSGSMNLNEIVLMQHSSIHIVDNISNYISANLPFLNNIWPVIQPIAYQVLSLNLWSYNCFLNFIGCIIFIICSIAEVNRIPFDLPEAESELVSGFSTEYSGIKFAMFFMAEYVSLFAVALLTIVLFFGGYLPLTQDYIVNILIKAFSLKDQLPILDNHIVSTLIQIEQALWLSIKVMVFVFFAIWIRATLPRLRPDQMMAFCWKFLLPLSLANLIIITLIREFTFN